MHAVYNLVVVHSILVMRILNVIFQNLDIQNIKVMEYYNNTGWEVGDKFDLQLPDRFLLSVAIENTHLYELPDGRLEMTGPHDPHHAVINCMVIRILTDADGVKYRSFVPDTDEQFDEQADFFRYAAECKLQILKEREEIDIIKEKKKEIEIINSFKSQIR
jgi:hypothetical protein